MSSKKSIIGIGNALMDIVVKLTDEELLAKNNLPKGSMTLVDAETSNNINTQSEKYEQILAPGGSAANTIHGLAYLGAETGFIGKTGFDELGKKYEEELSKIGVSPKLFKSETSTGVALALVTPDSERTFATYLGAAIELVPEEITIDLFRNYDIAYIEGYLVQNHDLVRKAAEMARKAGLTIALDLASYNVVEDNIDFLKEIATDYIDIVFANEEEAKAFTGLEPEKAIDALYNYCDVVVVKTGKTGSLIKNSDETIKVDTIGTTCIDTTGAGDLYASGFLYGLSCNYQLANCGKIASLVAGNVITVYGARMDDEHWKLVNKKVSDLI
ncbi:MAG: adenosine kinase [Prolixibacteraceae bacterium]|jgi:sugar/nucleoside kinase (ribokinase family)|nr:adenosine kinase [Prolixibacteraceae bacterium]